MYHPLVPLLVGLTLAYGRVYTYTGQDQGLYIVPDNVTISYSNNTLEFSICLLDTLCTWDSLPLFHDNSYIKLGTGAVTVLGDGSISGMLLGPGLQLEPLRSLKTQLGEQVYSSIASEHGQDVTMVIELLHDTTTSHHLRGLLGQYPSSDARWEDCFGIGVDEYVTMPIGIVMDYGFYKRSRDYDPDNIYSLVNSYVSYSNLLYGEQLGILIQVGESVIKTSTDTEEWNQDPYVGCTLDIIEDLQSFRSYVSRTHNDDNLMAEWHLFTDCYSSGTVGVAYVGTICTSSYRVGISSYKGSTTWVTVAHELGHNIGAHHTFEQGEGTTGGIMDYGDGTLNEIYQFNTQYRKEEVCATLTEARYQEPWCFPGFESGSGTYIWEVTSSYGACSAPCGNSGTQSRELQCIDISSNLQVNAEFCGDQSKPAETRQCNYLECQDTDCVCGPWSDFISTCHSDMDYTNNKTRTRSCTSATDSCEADGYAEQHSITCFEDADFDICYTVDMAHPHAVGSFSQMADRVSQHMPKWTGLLGHSFSLIHMVKRGNSVGFQVRSFEPEILGYGGDSAGAPQVPVDRATLKQAIQGAGTPHWVGATALIDITDSCWQDPGEDGVASFALYAGIALGVLVGVLAPIIYIQRNWVAIVQRLHRIRASVVTRSDDTQRMSKVMIHTEEYDESVK